jgi:hypothetical protein
MEQTHRQDEPANPIPGFVNLFGDEYSRCLEVELRRQQDVASEEEEVRQTQQPQQRRRRRRSCRPEVVRVSTTEPSNGGPEHRDQHDESGPSTSARKPALTSTVTVAKLATADMMNRRRWARSSSIECTTRPNRSPLGATRSAARRAWTRRCSTFIRACPVVLRGPRVLGGNGSSPSWPGQLSV